MCMCWYIYMHLNTHIIHIYMSIFISTFIYKTQSRTYSFIRDTDQDFIFGSISTEEF